MRTAGLLLTTPRLFARHAVLSGWMLDVAGG